MSNELGNTPADKEYQPSGISKAEEAAQQYYDDNSICCSESLTKEIFIAGYEKAEQDITNKAKYSSGWDGFFYGKGYEAAEKDLALTIQDLELLHTFLYAVKNNKQGAFTFTRLTDEQYAEVLKRYKEEKQ